MSLKDTLDSINYCKNIEHLNRLLESIKKMNVDENYMNIVIKHVEKKRSLLSNKVKF